MHFAFCPVRGTLVGMFTGIIEKTVPVVSVADGPMFRRLVIDGNWPDLGHGESIAVNGVCLTIASIDGAHVGFDVIKETLDKTNLGTLKSGDRVNVERALRVGDRIDGHFVQGHVDGTARLAYVVSNPNEFRLGLETPPELARYFVAKGSVSIDGVSLTIAAMKKGVFEVALIPTTLSLTTLGDRP
jgi:riboflavin synthase